MKKFQSDEWAGTRKLIEDLLHEKGRSARDVSLAIGKTHNYVHNIINRTKYRITKQAIREILDEIGVEQSEFDARLTKNVNSVPLYGNVPAQKLSDGGFVDQWVQCACNENVNLFGLTVTGSSMEPVYRPGDTLIIQRVDLKVGNSEADEGWSALEALDGKDVLCVRNGEATLKRFRLVWVDGKHKVELFPVNTPIHAPVGQPCPENVQIRGVVTRRFVK